MQSNRILYLDFIKVVAIFLVILVHTSSPVLSGYGKVPMEWWWIANFYDTIARISVPLFFMVSGYLLLNKVDSIGSFYKKRLPKILIPMFFWSVFFILFSKYVEHKNIDILHSLLMAINKSQYNHLWFLYAYLGLLISTPILMSLVQKSSQNIVKLLIVLWIIDVMIVPDIKYYMHLQISSHLPFGGYIGYFLLGYLLGDLVIDKKKLIIATIIFVLVSVFITIGTHYLTASSSKFNQQLYSYIRLPVFLQSLSAFIILKYIGQSSFLQISKVRNSLMLLGSTIFGIYLVHPIFLRLMIKGTFGFSMHGVNANALYTIPITTILAFVLSFFLVLTLQKIPYLRTIVPK